MDSRSPGIKGFGYKKEILETGDNPFRMGSVREVTTVTDPAKHPRHPWYADFLKGGDLALTYSYASPPKQRPRRALHRLTHSPEAREFDVNHSHRREGTWVLSRHLPFAAGKSDIRWWNCQTSRLRAARWSRPMPSR